jgi:hypothetical protein
MPQNGDKMPDESNESRSQIDKFRDLARELEADEDEAKFEDAMRRIAKTPPPKDETE